MNDAIDIAAVAAIGAIGQPLRRKEDYRLLTGNGRFTDDFNMAEQAYAVMVRSPYPHARMVRVDGSRAQRLNGPVAPASHSLASITALSKRTATAASVTGSARMMPP